MKPSELYQILEEKYPDHKVQNVCMVDTSCKKNGFCPDVQAYPVLDFDEIKNDFCRGTITLSSVDAVCVGELQKYFCFVELKGWERYIKYIGKQRKSVAKTVSGYNLEGKLKDSQKLCMEIVADSVIFSDMPVFFLLVTDIDVKSHGIEALAEMLDVLGETSTDIYSQCISESGKVLDSEILIGHKYIYCKEFDKVMATL
mgnify:FL=1|nr:hypothetical protein [uncultured Prevotella sp.]